MLHYPRNLTNALSGPVQAHELSFASSEIVAADRTRPWVGAIDP
jgi:hypothetical protein